ncbi:hypothetical protein KP509_23G037700 [Ceratopteris richardii]|uniref:Bidirectional sugar transporter SWEET n=1 Tax=Ceratopteris richardii TaxID=49495 RepID=A0A8T2S182_CERRI|nr:hypothetical protein KP509_23G037700 [Ceratopteris richardii]
MTKDSKMMGFSSDSIVHTLLGISGNVVTVIFFMTSTLKPSWMIVKQKGTNNIMTCSVNQIFVFMLFNCVLWVFYGLPINRPHNFWVILTNGIGAVLALITVASYYFYTSRKEKLIVEWELETFFSLFFIMILYTVMVNKDRETRIEVVGTISAILSSCMHLALLFELQMAWKKQDLKQLHLIPSIAAFLKGALWTAYGWSGKDIFIMVPNAIGVVTGIIQLTWSLLIHYNIQRSYTPEGSEMSDKSTAISHSREHPNDQVKPNDAAVVTIWTVH